MSAPRSVETFSDALVSSGPSAALGYLNEGVAHRYSAVYRLCGRLLVNVALHDKLGHITPDFLAEVPFEASFCQFVVRDGLFRTDNSGDDARLNGHPYQGVVVSYHGSPIMWHGEIWGSMCHFDLEVMPLPETEFELLKAAAVAWSRALPDARNRRYG
jgi:GAF domain-containing protein